MVYILGNFNERMFKKINTYIILFICLQHVKREFDAFCCRHLVLNRPYHFQANKLAFTDYVYAIRVVNLFHLFGNFCLCKNYAHYIFQTEAPKKFLIYLILIYHI